VLPNHKWYQTRFGHSSKGCRQRERTTRTGCETGSFESWMQYRQNRLNPLICGRIAMAQTSRSRRSVDLDPLTSHQAVRRLQNLSEPRARSILATQASSDVCNPAVRMRTLSAT
jgi:hypothetical protein